MASALQERKINNVAILQKNAELKSENLAQ